MHESRTLNQLRSFKLLAALLAVVLLSATLSLLTTDSATGDRTTLRFGKVSADGHKMTVRYTINRRPSHITGRTCFLSNGLGRVEAKCGRLPREDTRPTRVEVVLRGLPLGQYTFTVRATHKRSLLAKGTTKPVIVGNGLELDQSSREGPLGAAPVAASCPDVVVGADQAQTFTAGTSGDLRAVSVVAIDQGAALDLIVDVTTLAGGIPGSVIGTGTYSGSGSPDNSTFVSVPVDMSIDLVEGNEYAIVLSSPDPTGTCASDAFWSVGLNVLSTYAGGTAEFMIHGDPWLTGEGDLAFMTWMAP